MDESQCHGLHQVSPRAGERELRADVRLVYSKLLEMPQMRVYEVATFYTMFNRSVHHSRSPGALLTREWER